MPSWLSVAVLFALLLSCRTASTQVTDAMQRDVDRLVRAAATVTGTWPRQAPPPLPETRVVARHGPAVAPLLVALLSDEPNVERDVPRWKVQQQASLALALAYGESAHCGRIYCDGDPHERIANVGTGWRRVIASHAERQALSAEALLERFRNEPVFWRQFEIARALAVAGDRTTVAALEPWLSHDDRHLRGNVAYVLGRLGDPRGFETIAAILADRAPRSPGQGIPTGGWSLQAQIRTDRYYAAHLLGDLRDPRGVDVLIPLLNDADVTHVVPWALAEIADGRAVGPLMAQLDQDDPARRVSAIVALERLAARQALPRLRELLHDARPSTLGDRTSVGEAARRALAVISQAP